MSALTFKGEFINLSYVNDVLTFYPTFPYYEGDNEHKLRNCLNVIDECGRLDFVIKRLPDHQSTLMNDKFIATLENINSKKSTSCAKYNTYYDKFVRRVDDDHMIYHREGDDDKKTFTLDASHWHIKFRSILCREQISAVLDIFIENNIFSENEKIVCLKKIDERYINIRNMLGAYLTDDKKEDVPAILCFIHNCDDNDILANIHAYLTEEKFNYLRDKENLVANIYQGTDRFGKITETSKEWATIEKAITLQMSNNIRNQCTKFTPDIGKKFAEQLSQQYRFFAIKRKAKHGANITNDAYAALSRGDNDALANKSSKVFRENNITPTLRR